MRVKPQHLRWPFCIAASVAALLSVHALRWPPRQDTYPELRQMVDQIASALPPDSAVALRVSGLSEDHFNYLRYLAVPRPLELKMPRARRVLLLTDGASTDAAVARLQYERPDLQLVQGLYGKACHLLLFKPES